MDHRSAIAPNAPSLSESKMRAELNRIIVAAYDEGIALNDAARCVDGEERRHGLLGQAVRRVALQRDLATDVVALGGIPARSASLGARGRSWQRAFTRLLAGAHQGDAYDCCLKATQRTSEAYSRVLGSPLKDPMRQRLERERSEVDRDYDKLRRLRWGARVDA